MQLFSRLLKYLHTLRLYTHADHLGTPRAITRPNASNATVWRWDFNGSAFGDHAPNTNPDGDATHVTFNLRFPGQYFDAERGLHYNYFGDYETSTGRYVESDPIGLKGGINTYGYVRGNPAGLVDQYGMLGNPDAVAFCKIPSNSGMPVALPSTEANKLWKQETELRCTKVEQDCLEEEKKDQSRQCKIRIQSRFDRIEDQRCACAEDVTQCNFF